jgi:uncharacterized protein DUF3817
MPLRPLRVVATVELASLVLLLANLATVHWPAVASLLGPTHGCAYLLVIVLTFHSTSSTRVRVTAWIPGIGGVLVLRRLAVGRAPAR